MRLAALVIALVTGLSGALPAWAQVRCLKSGVVRSETAAKPACCPKCEAPRPEVEIGAPCCERIASVSPDARAPSQAAELLGTPPAGGFVALARIPLLGAALTLARPFGVFAHAPGERLKRTSAILRI